MADIMIDIESLDTGPDCVILTIGAVLFDPKGQGIIERLELRPTIEDQTELYNRTINDDTLRWWGEQSEAAQEEALGDRDRVSFKDCMDTLYKWCWKYNNGHVWSNGASFDIVVMESAWRNFKQLPPWSFWNIRDTRTIYDICGVRLKSDGHVTSHKAVEDAERQAIVVQQAYMKLIKLGLVEPKR
jgi:exodeoxyribonuclease VIII